MYLRKKLPDGDILLASVSGQSAKSLDAKYWKKLIIVLKPARGSKI